MTSSLNAQLGRLSASQLDTVTYLAGFDASLNVSTATFNAWFNNDTEATVQTGLQVGATITFSFDPTSKTGFTFSDAAKAAAAQSLAVWSGMSNINFVYTSDYQNATLLFVHANDTSSSGTTYGSGTSESNTTLVPTSTTGLNQATKAVIQLDTSGSFGDFTSYTNSAGYGIDTLVHEVGHLVGLGHTGPYNGTVTPSTDQHNSTDVRSWSIMSYIDPTNTAAKYYSSYNPTGVDFGVGASDGTIRAPYTPMGLDVIAAQRLYGDATNTMFAGGQTFGFNSNVMYTAIDGTQQKLSMYDFTVDTTPVVTLYDSGVGNTFDISGFTNDATVNLNDGTFSSVAGLSKNIFIEYGTRIDTLKSGSGNDVITVNADGDIVDGGGGTNTVVFSGVSTSYTIASSAGVVTVAAAGKTNTLTNIQSLQFSDATISTSAICFCADTMIATPDGQTAVQHLAIGDLVLTVAGCAQKVRWIGRQTVSRRFADPLRVLPIRIRIRAGAIADGVPSRDLFVSPGHAFAIDGILIQAGALVNGTTITRCENVPEIFTYYHIELASHALILAEGLAAETFVDNVDRENFDNWAEHQALFGDLPEMKELELPRAKSRRQVPQSIRTRLDARVLNLMDRVAA